MAIHVLGGGSVDGKLGVNPDWSTYDIAEGRIVQSLSSSLAIRYHIIEQTDGGEGNLLSNGLYANTALLETAAAVNTVNGKAGDVYLNTVNTRADGELLLTNDVNEIQATQSNPLPLAASVPANTVIKITVPETYKGITTTHLASGSDTTTDSNGTLPSVEDPVAGFVFNWPSGGTLFVTSNGVDNWRY